MGWRKWRFVVTIFSLHTLNIGEMCSVLRHSVCEANIEPQREGKFKIDIARPYYVVMGIICTFIVHSVECLLFPVKKYVSAIHEFPRLKRWHQVIFCWILRVCKSSNPLFFSPAQLDMGLDIFCWVLFSSCVKLSLKYFYGKQQTHQKLVHIYDLSPPLVLSGWIYMALTSVGEQH